MASLISQMHITFIKAIGCVAGVIKLYAEKNPLPSMLSKHSHLVKPLNGLLLLQFQWRLRDFWRGVHMYKCVWFT